MLADHSRFALGLLACANQSTETTRQGLTAIFCHCDLPWRMATKHGRLWAVFCGGRSCYTEFSVWPLWPGIRVSHSGPHHSQTQGKDERFHPTLGVKLLRDQLWPSLRAGRSRLVL